jgi:uncharacterized protein (DUF362 family)
MMTRRQFIDRMLALGLTSTSVAALLEAAACSSPQATAVPPTSAPQVSPAVPPTEVPQSVLPSATAKATSTFAPAPTAAAPAPGSPAQGTTATATPSSAYLSVVHGDDPAVLTRQAVKALGGMERFVKQGQSVIIKPNICVAYHGPEYAATTNPQVVAELVKLCREAGAASITVMDHPFGGTADQAYKISQIGDAVKAAGGQMVVMSSVKFKDVAIPDGKDIKKWPVYQDALKADVIIDVPIAKHHSLARLTLAGKNLMGLTENRGGLHANLGERLVDLYTLFKPRLIVVDAYRILMNNGPTGGDLNDVKLAKTIIASHDIVAADAYATTLFGLKPDAISYVKAGAARGLGTADLKSIKIEEITV